MLLAAEIVVFLGPSLSLDKAREMLEADFRPPAKRGDIYRAAREGARIICLIDGVFFQDCSVAHKEVLYALEAGARVLGASSMGALRASELDAYGMEGVGMIYEAYRSGRLVSDDEVALTFDPFTFAPNQSLWSIFASTWIWPGRMALSTLPPGRGSCTAPPAFIFRREAMRGCWLLQRAWWRMRICRLSARFWSGRRGTSRWRMHSALCSASGRWHTRCNS